MKQIGLFVMLMLGLLSAGIAQQADSVAPRLTVVAHELCASLTWQRSDSVAGATYIVYLR